MESESCIICCGHQSTYLFTHECFSVSACKDCGLLSSRQTKAPAPPSHTVESVESQKTRQDAYGRYLSCIQTAGLRHGEILIFGSSQDTAEFGKYLQNFGGYGITVAPYTESSAELSNSFPLKGDFDGIILIEALERSEDPNKLIQLANDCLKPDGVLMTVSVSLDSWSAKFFGRSWPGWRSENRHYFGLSTFQLVLEKNGFEKIRSTQDCRLYTLSHILDRAKAYPRTLLTTFIKTIFSMLPESISSNQIRISSSRVLMTAHKKPADLRPQLSIIMPVYNERATFAETLELVLAKQVDGVSIREIIIVESNSTDGTKPIVQAYESHPDIKVVYQEKPQGKGFAVRTGLAYATGDIVLIQDADTEYDVNDYDCLIHPVLSYQKPFVLGTRHKGDWKMRTFSDQPGVAALFNLGQILFTWLMNTLYSQRMTDPFTMYKVLRRECLYGLHFECNRFDFDHELVIKLLRKGYTPYEVPVNYNSRSYSEGKKVTVVLDPLLWIKANFKYRFISPFKSTLEADMLETSRSMAQSQEHKQLVKR